MRLLVIRATWGPPVFDEAAVLAEVAAADAFLRRSSYGRAGLRADVTPVVTGYVVPRECFGDGREPGLGPVAARARAAASALGYDLAAYDRFVYLFPGPVCGFGGLGAGSDVLLGGAFGGWRTLLHELMHTFRLPHASSAPCPSCSLVEYGDPLSVMGGGTVDFGAWEKYKLGWLERVERARNVGTFTIGAVDVQATRPQALTLSLPTGELWLEHRTAPEAEVIARIVRRPYRGTALRAVFLARGRESLSVPGLLRVRRSAAEGADARLELAWLDRRAPGRVRLTAAIAGPTPDAISLSWRTATEKESGVASYRVVVDGRVVATVTQRTAVVDGLRSGRHEVGVRAVDRAGNVGPPATATVRLQARR